MQEGVGSSGRAGAQYARCVVCARPFWLDWGGAEPWRMCPHCLKALGTEGRVPKADSPLGRLIRAACARARASERRRLRK